MTSYHPKDAEYGYCGNCHEFTRERFVGPESYGPPMTTMDERGKVTTTYPLVEPRNLGPSVMPVDDERGVDVVPEDHGPVLAPPTEADTPVVPLDPLGDNPSTRHT